MRSARTYTDMKENEQNLPLNDADELTAEEAELLKKVLDSSFPTPKTDIKASVMDRIKLENEKSARTRILRTKLVKYGSLAACIVLIATLSIKLLPQVLTKTTSDDAKINTELFDACEEYDEEKSMEYCSASASYNQALPNDTNGGYANNESGRIDHGNDNVSDSVPESYESGSFDEKDSALESNTEVEITHVIPPHFSCGIHNNSVPILITPPDNYTQPENDPASDKVWTVAKDCEHSSSFFNAYHHLPLPLLNKVDTDVFNNWAKSISDPCNINLLSFVEKFDLHDDLTALLASDTWYYLDIPENIEFTAKNAAQIEDYYKKGGSYQEVFNRYFEYEFKVQLALTISAEDYASWCSSNKYNCVSDWSIDSIVRDFKISEKTLTGSYDKTADIFRRAFNERTLPNYSFTKIMDAAASKPSELSGRAADEKFRIMN